MPLLILGISHHTAPVEVREQVALNPADYPSCIRELLQIEGVEEALVLGTCNRSEIYCLAATDVRSRLLDWFHGKDGQTTALKAGHFYYYQGLEAVKHLIRVAGGIDSLVLGEPQVLGQLKDAWQAALDSGGAGKVLDRLFQHTFAAAKDIRHSSGIGKHPVSVAYTAVVLARQIFGKLADQHVVLIGAGDMIRLCATHLREQGIRQLEIVNRSIENAMELAAHLEARATGLEHLHEVLPRADIIISSTASPQHVISRDDIRRALKQRRHRPMFLVDIAVPRDIDPACAELDDVYLYTIDDLQQVVDENQQHRARAAESSQANVDFAAESFMRWLHGLRAARSLERIRNAAHAHEQELVQRAQKRLEAGHDPSDVLAQLASTLTNRILHQPSLNLRQAAEQHDLAVLQAAERIFAEAGSRNDPGNHGSEEQTRDNTT
jgi:glutamyl-tRNA reductase